MALGVGSLSGFAVYQGLTPEKLVANKVRYSKSAMVEREVAYFREKAAKVETVDDFLKDYRLLKFALTAYNMADQLEYPGRIKIIFKDDASDSKALVNRMTSTGYREINAAFDFFKSGVANLKKANFVTALVAKYYDVSYENSVAQTSPSVGDALYFERKIGSMTSGYSIIGDPIMFDVVKTALSIPSSAAANGKIERLKAWIERDLDMTRLNDTAYIKKIVQRFLVLKDVETMKSGSNGLLDMFA